MKIGKWVRTQRRARGWSRAELARRIRAEVGGVGRWERDECLPHLEQFRRMCRLFGCSADGPLGLVARPKPAPLGDGHDSIASDAG